LGELVSLVRLGLAENVLTSFWALDNSFFGELGETPADFVRAGDSLSFGISLTDALYDFTDAYGCIRLRFFED
jgi:hypothetical protein